MKKILTIALIAVLVVCALLLVACDKEEKKEDTTTAASTTKASTTKAKTTAEPTTAEITTEVVTTAFPAELLNAMPATLPDGRSFDVKLRLDMETNVEDWVLSGKSFDSNDAIFEGVKGVYGQGISIGIITLERAGTGSRRAEVTVEPDFAIKLEGVTGILFWVDFTGTLPNPDKGGACASITMDGNTYRANKDNGLSVGYYYLDGAWVETHNVNACRMQVPHQYKGWVYVPATSYACTTDASAVIVDDNGNFVDIDTFKVNLYTDHYDLTDENLAIIFDEVMWVCAK